MTSLTSQTFESYIPVYDTVPENWEQARQFLIEHLRKISNGVNERERGWFLNEEVLTGQQFIPAGNLTGTSQQFRSIFRKVIDFGALPNTTSKNVAHGITVDSSFTLLHLYGAASDPTGLLYLPLPRSSTVLNNNIGLSMNSTNVIVGTGINLSNYTRTFITIEYIKEV